MTIISMNPNRKNNVQTVSRFLNRPTNGTFDLIYNSERVLVNYRQDDSLILKSYDHSIIDELEPHFSDVMQSYPIASYLQEDDCDEPLSRVLEWNSRPQTRIDELKGLNIINLCISPNNSLGGIQKVYKKKNNRTA